MKKRITQRAVAGLLVVLALAFTAGATSAFVGAKPFYLDAPLRFDYVPSGAGDKPILATDLDGNYVKSVAHSNQAITVTLQDGQNAQHTLSIPVGATLTGATYVADTETLTLTLSEGDPITADLSGLTTSSEVATAISAAIAAETDAVLTGATYAADSETLTLTLSEGSPVTGDLSGLATAAELSGAINAALDGVSGVTLTGASYAADSETLTLTLSEGDPITADLSGLTTSSEVATAISAAIAAETDAVLTGATYAADSETLTLTLSEGSPVTGDLSGLTTAAELSGAINAALDGVSGVTLTGASYAADSETLTLTLSEGDPITADLSGLTTSSEVATAISAAIAAETDAVLTGATYAADSETLTLTLSEGSPVTGDLSGLTTAAELSGAINAALDGVSGVTLTGASYAADSETLTLTLSEGDPITADLSGLTTSSEVATAISAAIAAETDAVLTGATYAADTKIVTLTLSEGTTLTVTLSDLTTSDEVAATVSDALANATDATVTGASFAADTQTFSITLSEGGPVTASLSDLTTETEVSTAITTALAGVVGTTVTGASYADDTELLTITLSDSSTVTADLSNLTTSSELSAAMLQILSIIAASIRPTVTGASFATDTKILSLTLSSGDPITVNLSSLSADAEIITAVANATAGPTLLGTAQATGADCQIFKPTNIVIPQTGWVTFVIELRANQGQYIHNQSMPVSLLHGLPVKIAGTATSATVINNTAAANALSLPVRALSDGYHVGLTNDHRLVARASHQFSPCRISVYTGHTLATSPTSTTSTTDTTPTQNSSIAFDPDTRVLTLTHGDLIVSTANLAHHPFISASTNIIWGISSDATITTDELTYFSNQGSTASILYRAADFNGASAHMAFAIRSPSTVTSLTSAVGGSNLCTSGLWSPCRSNAQITINNRLWNVYLTSSAVALPADAVGVVAWE